MNVDKATFEANADTVRLREIAKRGAYNTENYNLTDMCSSGKAIADALTVMQQIGAPVTDAYNEAKSQRDKFSTFVKNRVDTANMLIADRDADYSALSEITARALLALIKSYPTATREIKLATHFCKIVAKIRDTKSSHKVQTIASVSAVVEANQSSLAALDSLGCMHGDMRKGSGPFQNVSHALSKMDSCNGIGVFAKGVSDVLRIFPMGTAIGVSDCNTLGYSNCRVEDDCGFDKIAPINFEFSNHYGVAIGASGKVIGNSWDHSYSASMFSHEPFPEFVSASRTAYGTYIQSYATQKNATIDYYASQSPVLQDWVVAPNFFNRYYTHASYTNPALRSLPYRHFVFAEMCLVRLLLRERNALLNAIQAERAEAVSVALWKAIDAATPAYVRETEAARDAAAEAEAVKPAAKKIKKVVVRAAGAKTAKPAKPAKTPKK